MSPRPVLLIVSSLCIFISIVVVLLATVKGTVLPQDYFIAGVTGTFAVMVLIFGALLRAR